MCNAENHTLYIRVQSEHCQYLGWMHVFANLVLPLVLLYSHYASYVVADILFGFKVKDATFLSVGSAMKHNGVTIKDDFDWVRKIDDCLIGATGDISDCESLFQQVENHCTLHGLNFEGRSLPIKSIAHLCQTIMIESRLGVKLLVAGWEKPPVDRENGQPKLFWIDDTAALQDVTYSAHGREMPFLLSMLDQNRGLLLQSEHVAKSVDDPEVLLVQGLTTTSNIPSADMSSTRSSTPSSDAVAVGVARQCWSQLRKRSHSRVDVNTARLLCVDQRGVRELSLDLAESL